MAQRNRRQFLEDSMLAAAAAVTASGPGEMLADVERTSQSAVEKLGVAVIGVRGRRNSHLRFFAGRQDTELLYVCDVDRDVGARRALQVGRRQRGRGPQFVEDIRAAFQTYRESHT